MTDKWRRESPEGESNEVPWTVTATPDQLLTGVTVGLPTLHAFCVECNKKLNASCSVVVYAYRTAESETWDLRRCYCPGCSPSRVRTPTLGVSELLVEAALGTVSSPHIQSHRLCLTAVEPLAYSPPREGTHP
jgi:hypothetical protein